MSKQKSGPIDILIGQKLKTRRLELGMSQQQIATSIGVTFQQIQKYERGSNRISSSKLHELAKLMQTHINYFFSDSDEYNFSDQEVKELAEAPGDYESLSSHEKAQLKELIGYFNGIKDEKLRLNILNLTKNLERKH